MTDSEKSEDDEQTKVVSGCKKPDRPNYESVSVPAEPPAEYSTDERRGELLQLVRQAGHPGELNQTELAERYGVSQQMVSKDLDNISDHVDETLGERRALVSEAVYHRAIQGLIEDGEWRKAAQTVSDWNDWVSSYRHEQEVEERLDAVEQALTEDDR